MADPISITTTFITFATFVKDLIDLGQSIKRSIEKVGENRKCIQALTEDILRTLMNLFDLVDEHETAFQPSHLSKALEDLKQEMLYVLGVVNAVAPPVQTAGIRRISSQMKRWVKREEIEQEIQNLQEHISKCFAQFTLFSSARMEYTALRVEQALLVNSVENETKLRRLEKMMAHLLLNTEFGKVVVHRTADIISSDSTHKTLESQYLSAQVIRLVGCFERLLHTNHDIDHVPLWDESESMEIRFIEPKSPICILKSILTMILQTEENTTGMEISRMDLAEELLPLGTYLSQFGMHAEAMASDVLAVKFIRSLAAHEQFIGVIPRLTFALSTLAKRYRRRYQYDLALTASQQSLHLCHLLEELSPAVDNRPVFLSALVSHSDNLFATRNLQDAIATAQQATIMCRPILTEILDSNPSVSLLPEDEWRAVRSCEALFTLAKALSLAGHHYKAYLAVKEALQTVIKFAGSIRLPSRKNTNIIFTQLCKMAEAGMLSLPILTDTVNLYRKISQIYQEEFSLHFLPVLYAHARLFAHNDRCSIASTAEPLCVQVEPASKVMENALRAFYIPPASAEPSSPVSPLIHYFFTKHFEIAHIILRKIIQSLISEQTHCSPQRLSIAVARVSDTLSSVSLRQQMILLEIAAELVGYFRTLVGSSMNLHPAPHFLYGLWWYCWALWLSGRLEEALAVNHEAVQCLRSISDGENSPEADEWLLDEALILFDMGRISEANCLLESLNTVDGDADDPGYSNTYIRSQILTRTGRHQEALSLLTKVSRVEVDNVDKHFIQADLAAAHLKLGQSHSAIACVEKMVAACRVRLAGGSTSNCTKAEAHWQSEDTRAILAYAQTTLSVCLMSTGRNEEALFAAKEAVALALSLEWPLNDWPAVFRSEELIADALHTLSLCLRTAGQLQEALSHANHATGMYRELVSLAPRHLPALATTLENLTSILWDLGQKQESIDACKEAAGIIREVASHESYFTPWLCRISEQLASRLAEVKDNLDTSRLLLEVVGIHENSLARIQQTVDEMLLVGITPEPICPTSMKMKIRLRVIVLLLCVVLTRVLTRFFLR